MTLMPRLLFVVIVAIGLATTMAAARGESSPYPIIPDALASHQKPPLFVVMSGFASCRVFRKPRGTAMFAKAKQMMDALQQEWRVKDIPYIVSCFADRSDVLRYTSSQKRNEVHVGSIEDFRRAIVSMVESLEPHRRVVVIGHSYGGWLALAKGAFLPENVEISYLATIDPISMPQCRPEVFLQSVIGLIVKPGGSGECTSAPTDLQGHYGVISKRVANWDHFYQDRFRFLRSGPIDEAHQNHHIDYNMSVFFEYRAHQLIDRDERVWSAIADKVSNLNQ